MHSEPTPRGTPGGTPRRSAPGDAAGGGRATRGIGEEGSAEVPDGRALLRRLVAHTLVFALAAIAVISLYLSGLLRLHPEQWRGFVEIVVVCLALVFPAMLAVHWPIFQRIRVCLDHRAAGTATPEELRAGFAAVADFPRYWFVWGLGWWGVGGAGVGLGLWLRYDDFSAFQATVVMGATVSAAVLTDMYYYLTVKRLLEPVRSALAEDVGDPAARGPLVRHVSLRAKLVVATTSTLIVTAVYAGLLAHVRTDDAREEVAVRAQHRLLDAWATAPQAVPATTLATASLEPAEDGEERTAPQSSAGESSPEGVAGSPEPTGSESPEPFSEQPSERSSEQSRLAEHAARLGVAEALLVLDAESGEALEQQPAQELSPRDWAWTRASVQASAESSGAIRGDSRGLDGPAFFAWQRLGDGRVAVAVLAREALAGGGGLLDAFASLVLFATAVAMGAAWLLARDVGGTTAALRRQAERVAAGDLGAAAPVESEDDLGELARAFETMRGSLAATVGRVAGAADRMQSAAEEIATAARSVTTVTVDQVQGLERATGSMGTIDVQVRDIADSGERLAGAVHEVTAAVFELDATGGELHGSAAALSGHTQDMASSIEEMGRSIGQVAGSADGLAGATDETSSSMTQTSKSVREADRHAREMARLSQRVSELADSGRGRVHETIEGMDAIRASTDAAQAVIERLAEGTRAIDAVVDVIDDVADETNLLALNAAIIAAQAGDRGRGFAVVADQIKELADRVLTSTREIADLVGGLQRQAEEATGTVARGAEAVARGVGLAGEAGVSLEEITRAARESGGYAESIARAVAEQSEAVDHVAAMMERVREGTEQIRQALFEQGKSTDLLRQSSQQLDSVAGKVRGTTEEQVRSSRHIRDSIQSVKDAVDRIDAALRDQSSATREALGTLEEVAGRTRTNEEAVRHLETAMEGLRQQAAELRHEVQGFRTEAG